MDAAMRGRGVQWLLVTALVVLAVQAVACLRTLPLFDIGFGSWGTRHVSLQGGSLKIETGLSRQFAINGGPRTRSGPLLLPRVESWRINGRTQWRAVYVPLSVVWGPLFLIAAYFGLDDFRRKPRHGACAACGYDLTGLSPEAVCPECGQNRA